MEANWAAVAALGGLVGTSELVSRYKDAILAHKEYEKDSWKGAPPSSTNRRYQRLLDDGLPLVIHNDADHRRLLAAAAELMEKPDEQIGEEEGRLLEMLAILIEEYEDRRHPLPQTEPHEMLAYLLAEKGMKPGDLCDILPKSRISEILNGKRGISKSQAKNLAQRFRVPAELFL